MLEFRTLGGFAIRRGAYAVDGRLWERKVAERLVRFLLVRGGEHVPEDELVEAFWPDRAPSSARRALAAGPERIPALEAATRLWTGEPLPEERHSDWAAGWRERLISLYADALGSLVEAHVVPATPLRRSARRGHWWTLIRSTSMHSAC